MKKICFFGIYDSGYSRNRIMRKVFEENSFEVFDCNIDPRNFGVLKKYWFLAKKAWTMRDQNFDFIFVAFPGHTVVWLAKIIFKQKIIFDAFLSIYDSNVFDRKLYSKWSLRAFYDWFLDWSSCFFADIVVLDTNEHIRYFKKTFFVSEKKMVRCLVGAVEDIFYPSGNLEYKDDEKLLVHFHGSFVPLQGVSFIIDAIKILEKENILFQIIGNGQEYKFIINKIKELNLKNIIMINKVPLELLPEYINKAHICLGIFGNTDKTQRVIPNKVYEYSAMGKAIITGNTPAIKEVFTDGQNMIFCHCASAKTIAYSIKLLKDNPKMIKEVGDKARVLFDCKLKAKNLGGELISRIM